MIVVQPALSERPEIFYVAQARSVTMASIGQEIGEGIVEVEEWLRARKIESSGPPLIRYRVIDMDRELQIEIGWPVPAKVAASVASSITTAGAADASLGRYGLVCDSLPAGTYAALTFRNPDEGIEGNGVLILWAREKGYELDQWEGEGGDIFRSRVEFELSDPGEEPDRTQWETEVAILIKRK